MDMGTGGYPRRFSLEAVAGGFELGLDGDAALERNLDFMLGLCGAREFQGLRVGPWEFSIRKAKEAGMNDFEFCHNFTALWEGGFCDVPEDRGGATNYGVSLRFLKGFAAENPRFMEEIGIWEPLDPRHQVNRGTIRRLTKEQARAVFRREFWDGQGLDGREFPLPLAAKLLLYDAAVNCGPRNAARFAQLGHNALLGNAEGCLAVDGLLGPKSRRALADCPMPKSRAIIGARREHYERLCGRDYRQKRFFAGWMRRLEALERELGKL